MDRHGRATRGAAQFTATSVGGLAATVAAGVLLALVFGLVVAEWQPLQAADIAIVAAANEVIGDSGAAVTVLTFVTDLGGAEAVWLILIVTTVWLLVRRLRRLAAYVAVTGLGAAALSPGLKAAVDRLRPLVDIPVATAPGPSFPSGHALGSTVAYGVLVLVFLPAVRPRWRLAFVVAGATAAIAVGLTRVALGVHYPSDVLAGWLLGLLWLAVTATAFRRWREQEGLRSPLSGGLAPEARPELEPAPAHSRALPAGWQSAAGLVVAAALLWGAMVGLGYLVTDVLTAVQRFDVAVVRWFAANRTESLTDTMVAIGRAGGTVGIVVVLLVAASLALAFLRRWRPALFLLLATVGETVLFLAIAATVQRGRPPVDHVSEMLPPTSSFPSGHVAASVATYGGIALVTLAWSRGWSRYVAVAIAVLLPGAVAVSRLYRGVHHPTDVLASVLYALAWVLACWFVLRPGPAARVRNRGEVTER